MSFTNGWFNHLAECNGALHGGDVNIAIVDVAKLQRATTFSPPMILGVMIQPTPAFGFATAQFADPIHPTAVMNGFVANDLIFEMNCEFCDNVPFYNELELAEMAGLLP